MTAQCVCTLNLTGIADQQSAGVPAGLGVGARYTASFTYSGQQPPAWTDSCGVNCAESAWLFTGGAYNIGVEGRTAAGTGFRIRASDNAQPEFAKTEYSIAGTDLKTTIGGVAFQLDWNLSGPPRLSPSLRFLPLLTQPSQLDGFTRRRFWTTGGNLSVGGQITEVRLMCTPGCEPRITTSSLPSALTGRSYAATLTGIGGAPPYSWTASGLPSGFALSGNTISSDGNPAARPQTYGVTLTVTDSAGRSASRALKLEVR